MAEECGGIERKESDISLKPLLESYRLLSLPFHLATKKERLHLVNLNVELLCYCVVPLIFFLFASLHQSCRNTDAMK